MNGNGNQIEKSERETMTARDRTILLQYPDAAKAYAPLLKPERKIPGWCSLGTLKGGESMERTGFRHGFIWLMGMEDSLIRKIAPKRGHK
ncbi:MAG: hypothetical protein ACI4OJ_07440 [Lachnospiraceae bacterium]